MSGYADIDAMALWLRQHLVRTDEGQASECRLELDGYVRLRIFRDPMQPHLWRLAAHDPEPSGRMQALGLHYQIVGRLDRTRYGTRTEVLRWIAIHYDWLVAKAMAAGTSASSPSGASAAAATLA